MMPAKIRKGNATSEKERNRRKYSTKEKYATFLLSVTKKRYYQHIGDKGAIAEIVLSNRPLKSLPSVVNVEQK